VWFVGGGEVCQEQVPRDGRGGGIGKVKGGAGGSFGGEELAGAVDKVEVLGAELGCRRTVEFVVGSEMSADGWNAGVAQRRACSCAAAVTRRSRPRTTWLGSVLSIMRSGRIVGADECGAGNESPGAGDLDLAEVDTGDVVTAIGQCRGDRGSAAAAQVQDAGADWDLALRGCQPGPALDWVVGVAAVEVGTAS
jgi:hypothetical protein